MTATIDRSYDHSQLSTVQKTGIDRLPLQKKVNLLSDRGLWPQLEPLAKQYGWSSAEVTAFIDKNLPKAPCPICTREFYVYSKRVKYCSDRCRRQAAAVGHVKAHDAPPPLERQEPIKPKPKSNGDLYVRLERLGPTPGDRRYYTLMVVQDMFGSISLVRRWGRDEAVRSQKLTTNFQSLDEAFEQLERYKEVCLKRGYRLTLVERGHVRSRDA